MNKWILLIGAVFGAAGGLLWSIAESPGVQLVMMTIGLAAGLSISGAVASIGKKGPVMHFDINPLAGLGMTQDDVIRNYWRDQGRPPFTNDSDPSLKHLLYDPLLNPLPDDPNPPV